MSIDLPPLSAFTPDPAVARARMTRDTLTLALEAEQVAGFGPREVMSGTVSAVPFDVDPSNSRRIAIGLVVDLALTITF